MDARETYTVGYGETAVRYMMRRYALRDAGFFLSRLKPGMRVLDCGCGPGSITMGLAEAVTPGDVVGADLDQGQVRIATDVAARRGVANVRFERASVYQLPYPDKTFDAVFSHALFEHLNEPLEALLEIKRVLKDGGLAGLASPDWAGNLMAPEDLEAGRAIEVYKAVQIRNGGNPYAGRELGRLLQEAGFSLVKLTAMYDCYEDVALFAELLAQRIEDGVGRQAVTGPGLTRGEVGDLVHALRQWSTQPGTLFAQAFVEAIGRVG